MSARREDYNPAHAAASQSTRAGEGMTRLDGVAVTESSEVSLTYVVVGPGTEHEYRVIVDQRLFVGRECAGIDDAHRLVIDDPQVSRHHLEIRLEPDRARACVVDSSSNGSRLNRVRLERGAAAALKDGDRIQIGGVELEFRSERFRSSGSADFGMTMRRSIPSSLVLVVGDVANSTRIAQHTQPEVLIADMDRLFGRLRELLARHLGTVSHYAGDAFFAIWEGEYVPDAAAHAVRFTIEAARLVHELGPELQLRTPDGQPVSMGWGVVCGDVAIGQLAGGAVSVLGDAANVAFRLAGLAGREGRPEIIVSTAVRAVAGDEFVYGEQHEVEVRGRSGSQLVVGVASREALPDAR